MIVLNGIHCNITQENVLTIHKVAIFLLKTCQFTVQTCYICEILTQLTPSFISMIGFCNLFALVPQLHDLKIGILERNQVIEEMQRHLLVQEVTNKLLEADNERWEMELQFFKRQRKAAILKRWQTFTGRDIPAREVGYYFPTSLQPTLGAFPSLQEERNSQGTPETFSRSFQALFQAEHQLCSHK